MNANQLQEYIDIIKAAGCVVHESAAIGKRSVFTITYSGTMVIRTSARCDIFLLATGIILGGGIMAKGGAQ